MCVSVSFVFLQFVPDFDCFVYVGGLLCFVFCLFQVFSFVEYSTRSGVKRVVCVLFSFSISLFCFVHCSMLFRYVWICSCAMLCLGWVVVIVMSSA